MTPDEAMGALYEAPLKLNRDEIAAIRFLYAEARRLERVKAGIRQMMRLAEEADAYSIETPWPYGHAFAQIIATGEIALSAPDAETEVRDMWWHCSFCGNSESAEPPHEIGDKEPCALCGDGTAEVMTLKRAARYEAEIVRAVRSPKRSYT